MRSTAELRRALPATLAAIAEAGVLYVILHDVAINEGRATGGPMASYPIFLAVFAVSVALATAFRQSLLAKVAIPVVALGIGLIQGTVWARGGLKAVGTAEILALLLALRVVTMAVRDWREPVAESFGFGSVILLGEVAFVARTDPLGNLMPAIVVLFFAGSLSSRAASVWLANRPEGVLLPGRPHARPQRSAVVLIMTLGAALIVAVMLGARGGPVEVSGAFVYRWAAEGIALAGGLLAAVLLPVLSWFLGLVDVHIEPQSVNETVQQIKPGLSSGGASVERIIGAIVFVLILLLLLRAIRRQWKLLRLDESGPEPEPEPQMDYVPKLRRRPRTPRIRRELPVDTIRRWYAEALLALERLGLPKSPSRTPGEYLPEVARAFPESARGFAALTRAYEQVRYGAIALDRDSVGRLEVERDGAMQALGRARRIDDPDKA
jgi:hypothetical protein